MVKTTKEQELFKLVKGSGQEYKLRIFNQLMEDKEFKEAFSEYFDKNMIYSEDTTSFVIRLSEYIKKNPNCNKNEIQNISFKILNDLRLEYVYISYKVEYLKDIVDKQILELKKIDRKISKVSNDKNN